MGHSDSSEPPVEPAKLGVINEIKYKTLKEFTNIIKALSVLFSQLLWSWVVSIFYFPQFRRLHWGLFKDYTYSVICHFKFVLTSNIEMNLQVIKSWKLKPIVILFFFHKFVWRKFISSLNFINTNLFLYKIRADNQYF